MNIDDNFIHKYYALFLSPNSYEDVSSVSYYYPEKRIVCRNKNNILDSLLNKSNNKERQVS